MSLQVNIAQAESLIVSVIKAKLVPMLSGSPGAGKSALVHQIADTFGLKVIDMRLAQCDPTDLLGFPSICTESQKAKYVPMSTFPIEGDAVPKGYNGWLLFLDEFSSASPAVQAAAYKLVLDKQVGEFTLHSKVAMICAGNLETDNAIVQPMSTALQSRLIHLELAVNPHLWIDWATQNGIDHRITSFINFKPDNLYRFHPDHDDKTYASPRTWEFTNRLIQGHATLDSDMLPLLAGTISEGVAREFIGFTKIFTELPTIQQVIAQPTQLPVPEEPSILYALSGSLSNHITADNAASLMQFVARMPAEFQVVCVREIVRRDKSLIKVAAITQWVTRNSTELF